MTKGIKTAILGLGGVVLVALLAVGLVRQGADQNFGYYPEAGPLPQVVSESMEEVLARFEAALKKHALASLERMQPGLSAEKIAELERDGGFQLSEELRALYRWRNGVPFPGTCEFFPMIQFQSLETVVDQRKRQDAWRNHLIIGHMTEWLPIFMTSFGDGYVYDPTRRPEQGAVFKFIKDSPVYTFYPSLKNLLIGFSECHEAGIFTIDANGDVSYADVSDVSGDRQQFFRVHEKSKAILDKYGVDRD